MTVQEADLLPSKLVAVIIASPFLTAVILPSEFTFTTLLSLVDHLTSWLFTVSGLIVAIRVSLSPG